MAVTFDPTSSQYLSNGPVHDLPDLCSISLWMQTPDWASLRIMLGRVDGGGSKGWAIEGAATDDSIIRTYQSGYAQDHVVGAYSANTWVHLLWIHKYVSGVGGYERLIKNGGSPVDQGDKATTPLATNKLFIGAWNNDGTAQFYWKGKIAEVAIWDNADLESHKGDLYTQAATGKAANHSDILITPTYYWSLDNKITADIGGSGVDLMNNNSCAVASHVADSLTIARSSGSIAPLSSIKMVRPPGSLIRPSGFGRK